jgi:hypothetical protein
MPRLVSQSEEFSGRVFDLAMPRLTVGRTKENNLQIEHSSVSSHHAVLELEGVDYKVKDTDSTNGTRVNGERISEHKLRRNDTVRFGNIEFLYDSEHSAPAQPLPEPSEGINLAGAGFRGRPSHFKNASPFPKPDSSGKSPWTAVYAGLGVLAAAALGFFFFKIFLS